MALPQSEIEDQIKKSLAGTPYEASTLKQLVGGITNFIFSATLKKPLQDGTSEVVLKHGEAYVAQWTDFKLSVVRCQTEEECLRYLSRFPHFTSPEFTIGTPKLYHFNQDTNTQVQEYLRDAVSLKHYAIKHYAAPTPEILKPQCLQLGRSLGGWLRAFHSWSNGPENQGFRDIIPTDGESQKLKHMINYGQLVQRVDKYPEILTDAREVFQQVSDQAAAETEDLSKLEVTHGDFWTGNVLMPDLPVAEGSQTTVLVVDWESTQLGLRPLDLGQMLAELWQLKLYKDIDAGEWIMEGFAAGYGKIDEASAFRAIVHVGVHLISFGSGTPGWGTPEQSEQLVRTGKDTILKAWRRDRAAFEGHALECLFGSA